MARLTVLTGPELATGFRLAGVTTLVADSPADGATLLRELLDAGDPGVLAVDEALLEAADAQLRMRSEQSTTPVVVALPTGSEGAVGRRRARLADMLRRSLGYHMTFPGESR